jgi:hypothetical protein
MHPDTTPLCVPPWDQSEALTLGAKYSALKGFFADEGAYLDDFWKWLPRMYDPAGAKPYLVPEMLPVTTWEKNVRHLMGGQAWDRMRKHAYKAAGFRCLICGDQGRLEAHESWELSNETCVQRLVGLDALCPLCHKAKHLGIARRLGMWGDVQAQLKRVNNWTDRQLILAIQDTFDVWEQRADWPWTVDLSWLQDNGYLYV